MRLDFHLSFRQQLVMTHNMQQALYVLQLPVEELAEWLANEIESNPLLEIQERRKVSNVRAAHLEKICFESASPESLYEHLQSQLVIGFADPEERALADRILASLDAKGFSSLCKEDIEPHLWDKFACVKEKIQELDPLGVGSFDVREYLLFQLKYQGKGSCLAFEIIYSHYNLLLQGEYSLLAKTLQKHSFLVKKVIQEEIAPLHLVPAQRFSTANAPSIVPDLIFTYQDDRWKILVNEEELPSFRMSSLYRKEVEKEAKQYFSEKKKAARFLYKACSQRKETLEKIGKVLLQKQLPFFAGEGRGLLIPLSCREVAEEVGLHESTVTRAISSKWLSAPCGVFPLSLFFKSGVAVSSESVKGLIRALIAKENKQNPLSDLALLQELQKKGVHCSRRTIAKYRLSLAIPSSSQR